MDVQVEDILSCSFAILLNNAYTISLGCFLDCDRDFLSDLVSRSKQLFRCVGKVHVVLLGDYECMPLADWADVHERQNRGVFINDAGRGFFSDYSAENAIFLAQAIPLNCPVNRHRLMQQFYIYSYFLFLRAKTQGEFI